MRAKSGDLVDVGCFPHGPDKIYLIEISLTFACQCECRHCAVGLQKNQGDLLTVEEIVDLCRQAKEELGAEVVELFGGEPLMHKEIVRIVRECSQYLRVWLSTNGMAFTRPLAQELADAGLQMAIFSLDSADRETHDRIRGAAGCYDAVMRGVEYCAEVGITGHLSACVTPEMLHDGEVDRLIELTRSSKAEKLCLLPAKMAGRFAADESVLVTDEEMGQIWQRTMGEDGMVYVETESNSSQNIGKCFCLRDWLYVNPYGVVQPCVYVFFDFGNVRDYPLKVLYRRMHEHPVLRDRSLMNLCLMQNPEFVRQHFSDLSEEKQLVELDRDPK